MLLRYTGQDPAGQFVCKALIAGACRLSAQDVCRGAVGAFNLDAFNLDATYGKMMPSCLSAHCCTDVQEVKGNETVSLQPC